MNFPCEKQVLGFLFDVDSEIWYLKVIVDSDLGFLKGFIVKYYWTRIYSSSLLDWTFTFLIQDGESGWSSLHRALHFGHLAVASVLLQSGALITLEDSKSRTPVDLLSSPLLQCIASGRDSGIYFSVLTLAFLHILLHDLPDNTWIFYF